MCGFAGAFNNSTAYNRDAVQEMASRVSFRGPDSCRVAILDTQFDTVENGNNAVFFNRLAIIDLDPRSDQPFFDDDHLLLFNGEIYNYPELKRELQLQGYSFGTESDTEVLFYALKCWGTDALDKLNGMFAFCWIDKKSKEFLIARDRLGIKPLYYHSDNGSFYFASELDTIIRLKASTPAISSEAVKMYMWMQFVPTPYTIYEGVYKLPPGQYLKGSIGRSSVDFSCETYWDAYTYTINNKQIPAGTAEVESALRNSLARQLHSDVPLGLFLSSGVDSSLLAALVNKYFAKDAEFNFYTVRFAESTASDESRDAEQFIRSFRNPNLRSDSITIDADMLGDHLDDLYQYLDEPFGDPASLLNWMISKKAREHVTVAISGDGADELFWGYGRYERWRQFRRYRQNQAVSLGVKAATALLPNSNVKDNIKWMFDDDPVRLHYNLFLPSGSRFKMREHICEQDLWSMKNTRSVAEREDLPSVLDIKTYLSDAMLYKVDRASMASSLEVRVPYLDNEVLELALRMPLSSKSNSEYLHKAPLKSLLKQLAPHYDFSVGKKGFSFPLKQWLQTKWKDRLESVVTKQNLEAVGLDQRYLRVYQTFKSTGKYYTDVWFIFNLLLWKNKTGGSR